MINNISLKINQVTVVGLGYVGLPLAIALSKYFKVIAYDINIQRINQLKKKVDITMEVPSKSICNKNILYTNKLFKKNDSNFYIITAPTPLNKKKEPDLKPLLSATKDVARIIKNNDIIVYESTIYPSATESICAPLIEKISKLKYFSVSEKNKILNLDDSKGMFHLGYSPERINPGDKKIKLENIIKVVSGSSPIATKIISGVYKKIIKAGIHVADSIQVAEAAKIIENTQRDINIALINEFSIIFSKMNIDTQQVLKAASTKWNFLNFYPGLVGGHCIGVDPYYLTYKAKKENYNPEIILAGRKLNDNMHNIVIKRLMIEIKKRFFSLYRLKVLVLGITFKENVPDIRNSRIINLVQGLKRVNFKVDVYDPYASHKDLFESHNISLLQSLNKKEKYYNAIIIAVPHLKFKSLSEFKLRKLMKTKGIIYDLKYFLPNGAADIKL